MAAPAWAPLVADVGAIMHARTKASGSGAHLGTFTADTRPTALQVEGLIEDATNEIVSKVTVPTAAESIAKSAAKYRAAMLVELSFFPSQVGDDPDIYDRLKENYESFMEGLVAFVADNPEADPDADATGNAATAPMGGFPGVIGTSLTEEW